MRVPMDDLRMALRALLFVKDSQPEHFNALVDALHELEVFRAEDAAPHGSEVRALREALAQVERGRDRAQERAEDWKREAESGQEAANANDYLRKLTEAQLAAAQKEADDLRTFLGRNGYRRCDVAACNCRGWHRGWSESAPEVLEQHEGKP